MKEKLNFLNKVNQGLLIELIKSVLLFLIVNGGFYLILDFLKKKFETLQVNWIFWIIIGLFAFFIFLVLFQRFNKNIPFFSSIESDFQILEQEIIHNVISKDKYIHKRIFKLKALRNGLRRYTDKFLWTGGDYRIKSGDDIHTVFLSGKINVFDTYIIDFDRTYNKNEIIDIIVEWELTGEGRPFISTQIEEPTNKLTLTLEFNSSLNISKVEYEETYLQGAKRTLSHSDIIVKNNFASQIINNPKLIHLYELRWKW